MVPPKPLPKPLTPYTEYEFIKSYKRQKILPLVGERLLDSIKKNLSNQNLEDIILFLREHFTAKFLKLPEIDYKKDDIRKCVLKLITIFHPDKQSHNDY